MFAEGPSPALPNDGGSESGAGGRTGGIGLGTAGYSGAVATTMGLGAVAATFVGRRSLYLAEVAGARSRGAAPGRRAHHVSRRRTVSLIVSRRQPRGVRVDWAQAG